MEFYALASCEEISGLGGIAFLSVLVGLSDCNRTQVWTQSDFSDPNDHLAAVGLWYSVALCVPNYRVRLALPILFKLWEEKKNSNFL